MATSPPTSMRSQVDDLTFPWKRIDASSRDRTDSTWPVCVALEAVFDQLQRLIDTINLNNETRNQ